MTWEDAEDIGIELSEKFPDMDPADGALHRSSQIGHRAQRFHRRPSQSTEGKLEAIQMAWYEEWKDKQ